MFITDAININICNVVLKLKKIQKYVQSMFEVLGPKELFEFFFLTRFKKDRVFSLKSDTRANIFNCKMMSENLFVFLLLTESASIFIAVLRTRHILNKSRSVDRKILPKLVPIDFKSE